MDCLFEIQGKVVQGEKRGRDLGFPTANIVLSTDVPDGIYASEVEFDGKKYMAASFVGKAETFGSEDYKLESYILDFEEDLYGKEITVKLYEKIRENQKFSSAELLIEKMKDDVLKVRDYFKISNY